MQIRRSSSMLEWCGISLNMKCPLLHVCLTLVLRRGVIATPRFFFNSVFCPINCAKRFYVVVFTSITHLFIYMRWYLGVSFGYWGSSKIMVGGVREIPGFLFCPFHKYFKAFMLQTCYVHENYHFLKESAKNPART